MASKNLMSLLLRKNNIAANPLKFGGDRVQPLSVFFRSYAKNDIDIDAELNKPYKYTGSAAHSWKAAHSRVGTKEESAPWYEPHIVCVSLMAFMVYFFILREENDLDLLLERPLSETLKSD